MMSKWHQNTKKLISRLKGLKTLQNIVKYKNKRREFQRSLPNTMYVFWNYYIPNARHMHSVPSFPGKWENIHPASFRPTTPQGGDY